MRAKWPPFSPVVPGSLLDVSPILRPAALELAVAEAQAINLVRPAELRDQLERHPSRPGNPSLRALIDRGRPSLTRSEAERRLLTLIRSASLPRPQTNVQIGPRARDADLVARGYTVLRITWRQLVDEPHVVVARIAAALARASG